MTAEPTNFYEYLQSRPADCELHAAHERYGIALDSLEGIDSLLLELMSASTALRSLLQEGSDSQMAVVAAYASMLATDAQLAGTIAAAPLIKEGWQG
jgi:hypothetical protein